MIERTIKGNTNPLAKIIKNLDFNEGLVVEPLLVPNNLYCNRLSCRMISTAQYLAERTLPEAVHYFVTVTKMVTLDNKIITAVIIVAVVVRWSVGMSWFLLATSSNVKHRRIIKDLLLLVVRQMLSLAALKNSFTPCQ
jgi:hypothetical protein